MGKRVLILLTLLLNVAGLYGQQSVVQNREQDVFVPIAKYIQNGDAERLSVWFAPSLELDILGSTNVCSRQQAKQIVKEFFSEYSPKSFVISYRSGKAPMLYAIGNLSAGGNKL